MVFGILDETSRTSVALLLWVLTTKVLLRWVRIEDALFGRGPWPDEGEDRVRAAVVRGWFLLGGAIVLAVAMG